MKLINIKSKKGDVFQIFFLLIILFIIALVGLMFISMSGKITTAISDTGILDKTPMASSINQKVQNSQVPVADGFVFLMFLFGNIAMIISATRTNFSPTLIFIFIFMVLFAVLVSSGMVNIYQGFTTDTALSSVSNQLTLTNVIFSKYTPLFMCVFSGIIIFIMYSKQGGDIQP